MNTSHTQQPPHLPRKTSAGGAISTLFHPCTWLARLWRAVPHVTAHRRLRSTGPADLGISPAPRRALRASLWSLAKLLVRIRSRGGVAL